MQPPHQPSRINLDEMKAQIVKKLGHEGSKQYFFYLQRYLSLKLSKAEFNKLCLRILGRENIPLHNQLIRSVLSNACCAKSPPKGDVSKHDTLVGSDETPCDGYLQNGSHMGMASLSNGADMLPVSPKKARSGSRDRRIGDRRSALAPNGKASFPHQSDHIMENGDLNPIHNRTPVHQTEDEREKLVTHAAKRQAVVYSKEKMESVVRNDRREASSRSLLQAPLGLPLCPVSSGGACRALPLASSSRSMATFDDGALLDSHALRDRMEHIALAQGLEGVSVECANILNLGLDSYIKGLLRSCIELVGARSDHESTKNSAQKLINGVKPGHHYQMQEQKILSPISLQEFRVSMELNPRQLGEDWPLLLEKICTHAFEE